MLKRFVPLLILFNQENKTRASPSNSIPRTIPSLQLPIPRHIGHSETPPNVPQADVTVYLPDFFGGETLDQKAILEGRLADLDIASFSARNSRANREPEVFACATALRAQGFTKIGAAGFCYGGWAVLRLGSAEHNPPLVDCVVAAHPSWVTEADVVGVEKPLLVLAPEADPVYPEELKMLTFRTMVIEKKNVPFEYVHLPGVQHGCLTKGREEVAGEREAMVKGKERAVGWFKQFLSD